MARVRTRWKRQVLAWWTLAAAFLLQFALVGASGQGFDATPQVRCPLPQPIVKFSSGTSPTRAGFVQHWIRQLRTQVPAVAVPPVLASVPRNDFVALCFAPASGPATEGLGTNADMQRSARKSPFYREPGHIRTAGELGLGKWELNQIEHRKLRVG